MKGLREFIRRFLNNKGQYVFTAMLITKVCAFLGSVFIIRLLSDSDFGKITVVTAVFNVFAAGTGLGLPSGLLRYGSIQENQAEKDQLSTKLFKEGFLYQIILTAIFLGVTLFYIDEYSQILLIFLFFAIRLLGFFYFDHIQSLLRVNHKNKQFAVLNSVFSIVGLLLILILTTAFGLIGYLAAIAIIPYVALFWKSRNNNTKLVKGISNLKEIRWYSLYSVVNGILNDLQYSLDILLLSFLMTDVAVAKYKVALLIPRNLVFLSFVFLQSDYISIAENYKNRSFLKKYVLNYYKLFVPICIAIFVIFYLFRNFIIGTLFGSKYAGIQDLFSVLLIAFLLSMLMRNLYGNIIAAVGRIRENLLATLVAIVVMIPLGFLLTPRYHEMGMALTVLGSVMVSNILYVLFFNRYLHSLSKSRMKLPFP